jgi:hypothetical protein
MSNPSVLWATLSLPNTPVGSIPFVNVDGVSIITDVLNFYYTQATATLATGTSQQTYQLTAYGGFREKYTDLSAAPATTYTINTPAGRIAVPAGQAVVTVTNSYCFLGSIVLCQMETADGTFTRFIAVAAAGSFVITGNANATGVVKISFSIKNVF